MLRKFGDSVMRRLRHGEPVGPLSCERPIIRHEPAVSPAAPRRHEPGRGRSDQELFAHYMAAAAWSRDVVMRSSYTEEAHRIWLRMEGSRDR